MNWKDILKVEDMNTGEQLEVDIEEYITELKSKLKEAALGYEGLVDSKRKARFEVAKISGRLTNPPIDSEVGCGIKIIARNLGEEKVRYDLRVRYTNRDKTMGQIGFVKGNELDLKPKDKVNGKDGLRNRIKQAIKDSINKFKKPEKSEFTGSRKSTGFNFGKY
jgi:hypothetical protein